MQLKSPLPVDFSIKLKTYSALSILLQRGTRSSSSSEIVCEICLSPIAAVVSVSCVLVFCCVDMLRLDIVGLSYYIQGLRWVFFSLKTSFPLSTILGAFFIIIWTINWEIIKKYILF